MVALQIRGVPDDVRRVLADRAAARGESLQSFLLALVTAEAERSANLSIVQRFAQRADGSRLSAAEVTSAVDLARAEREDRLAASRDAR